MDLLAFLWMILPTVVVFGLLHWGLFRVRRAWAMVCAGIGGILVIWVLVPWLFEVTGAFAKDHYRELKTLIPKVESEINNHFGKEEKGAMAMAYGASARGLAIYANKYPEQKGKIDTLLYNMASTMTNPELFPFVNYRKQWSDEVFFLWNLDVVLTAIQQVNPRDDWDELHKDINRYFAQNLKKSAFKHIRTWENDRYRVSDNAGILAALYNYEGLTDEDHNRQNRSEWNRFIQRELIFDEELFCSAFTKSEKCKEMPRANFTLDLLVSLQSINPELADDMWNRVKLRYKHTAWFNFYAHFETYHPHDTPPAYQPLRQHPVMNTDVDLLALRAAAALGKRSAYHQVYNRLYARQIFNNTDNKDPWKHLLEVAIFFEAEML